MLLALDPGVHGFGAALFVGGELASALYVSGEGGAPHPLLEIVAPMVVVSDSFADDPVELVVEEPQIYSDAKQRGRQRDLVRLIFVAGVAAGALTALGRVALLRLIQPAGWKGQLPKAIVQHRVEEVLSAEERAAIERHKSTVMHNVIDAVGIGLHDLGRIR